MKYDLIVVTREPFPYGLAATNRMISYLKGLSEDCKILFLTYSGPNYVNSWDDVTQCGVYYGINYRYVGNPCLNKKPSAIIRMLMLIGRYLKLCFLLLFVYRTNTVLLYSREIFIFKYMRFVSVFKGWKLYRDVTETNGADNTERSAVRLKKQMSTLDGIIVISKGIYDYFDNLPDYKKFILPVLIDRDRFSNCTLEKKKYVFYCSGMNLERDGLLDILKGFLIFNQNYPDYTMQIASAFDMTDSYHIACKKIIDENTDSIRYLGQLEASEIPQKLVSATALLLTPHKEYLTRGFPTKLGEYLASGTPTICSSINDLYEVVDHDAVVWVRPNHPEDIAESLRNVVTDPKLYSMVGERGIRFMIDNFTVDSFKKELRSFLGL